MIALIGDCGGTFSRFARLEGGAISPLVKIRNSEFESFNAVVQSLNITCPLATFAIAGAHDKRHIAFTNNEFIADASELEALGFGEVILMNDFVPLSLSLANLQSLGVRFLDDVSELPGNRLILGAGTGLGVGALMQAGDKFMPIATEGGHMSFGAQTPLEQALWQSVSEPICIETFLSGQGLSRIYKFLTGVESSPEELVLRLKQDDSAMKSAGIFWQILARYASDLALFTLAKGGVYLTGGMCERLIDALNPQEFRATFIDKSPYQSLLQVIPLGFVQTKDPAFTGLKAFIEERERFIV